MNGTSTRFALKTVGEWMTLRPWRWELQTHYYRAVMGQEGIRSYYGTFPPLTIDVLVNEREWRWYWMLYYAAAKYRLAHFNSGYKAGALGDERQGIDLDALVQNTHHVSAWIDGFLSARIGQTPCVVTYDGERAVVVQFEDGGFSAECGEKLITGATALDALAGVLTHPLLDSAERRQMRLAGREAIAVSPDKVIGQTPLQWTALDVVADREVLRKFVKEPVDWHLFDAYIDGVLEYIVDREGIAQVAIDTEVVHIYRAGSGWAARYPSQGTDDEAPCYAGVSPSVAFVIAEDHLPQGT